MAQLAARDIDRDDLPIPPQALRQRVHGATDVDSFLRLGETICGDILAIVEPTNTLALGRRVLDFGCGCGRVARFLHSQSNAELFGTDIDGEAIGWCRDNMFVIGEFAQNTAQPPLSYPDEFFDFVYSISVFTHLPRAMENRWLAELRRVVKPGGRLLLTIHAPPGGPWPGHFGIRSNLRWLRALAYGRWLKSRGFLYCLGRGVEGLPRFYGTSFHTEDYLRREWGRLFQIERIVPRGLANHQDLVLCRRHA